MNATTVTEDGIVLEATQPVVIDPARTKRLPVLEKDEARQLTTEIQRTSVRLWLLVTEAHDRAAHFALGYESWDDYVRAELQMSPSRSYQLLDTGHVMRELAAAGVDIDHMAPPPARVISRIKDRLPAVRKATKKALKKDEDIDKVLRSLAREPMGPAPVPRARTPEDKNGDDETPTAPKVALVTCPACTGDGKVTRSLANRLRPFMKSLTKST